MARDRVTVRLSKGGLSERSLPVTVRRSLLQPSGLMIEVKRTGA